MFNQKLTAALDLLSTTGMWRSNYAPPLFRLLWRCHVRVAPPHFRSMRANVVTAGAFVGVAWTTAMWWTVWRGAIPVGVALGSGALAGLLFGLSMGAYYRRGRLKHNLPDWESLVSA